MSALKTVIASTTIFVGGVAALGSMTHEFQLFTTESALRAEVRAEPRPLPDIPLQTATGQTLNLADLNGRWLLVNLIYTRCPTLCSVQGGEFAQLQKLLAGPIARGDLGLLSVSFDPAHDTPHALAGYKARFGDSGTGWIAARPTGRQGLASLKAALGVRVISDGLGGFEHNAAINVIDPGGRLVAILDWDDVNAAYCYLAGRLARPHGLKADSHGCT